MHPIEELLGSTGIFLSILVDESARHVDGFIENNTTLCYDSSTEHVDLDFDLRVKRAQQPLRAEFPDWT